MSETSEPTNDARIEHLLAEGRLTTEEAARLRASRERKPLWLLLAIVAVFFLLGAGAQWSLSQYAGGTGAPASSSELDTPAAPKGNLVDLSALSEERSTSMNRSIPLFIGVLTVGTLAVLGAVLAFLYNGLVSSREQVNAGWAQVENVYQRRLDLVPLLVDAVQAYTEHERETLAELTQARADAIRVGDAVGGAPPSPRQLEAIEDAQGKVESALARLLVVVEAYPDLKASRNFLTLQDQIEGTENRVAMERRSYNEFSRRYNTRLQTFPGNIVGQMMGFEFKPYFEAQPKALKGLEDPFGRHEG